MNQKQWVVEVEAVTDVEVAPFTAGQQYEYSKGVSTPQNIPWTVQLP